MKFPTGGNYSKLTIEARERLRLFRRDSRFGVNPKPTVIGGHGKWQGELKIAGESWVDADLDPLALENLHIQQIVVARCGDKVGHGVLEQMHIGPSVTHGFADWFDGAK